MDKSVKVARLILWRTVGQSHLLLLSHFGKSRKRKKVILIKEISKAKFRSLIKDGIIGECHMTGNYNKDGRHSCGYYDKRKYDRYISGCSNPNKYDKNLKLTRYHVGVVITNSKIYIEDAYAK